MQGHHTHHRDGDHDHDHDHQRGANSQHGHGGHSHQHKPANFDRAFAIGVTLNLAYAASEAVAGIALGSLALVADAGHNLSDVLGLLLAWGAVWLSRRAPSATHSYGLGRSSILAALANALLLLVAVGVIIWEAVHRFSAPQAIATTPVVIIACIGIAINAFTAWLFMRGAKDDLNIRGAYLHMAADAAVSFGVVLSALAMQATSWYWLDPVTSIVIAIVIAWGTWGLLRESLRLSMDGVPHAINMERVTAFLANQPEVKEVHDLHVWALSTEATALTAHVVCPAGHPGDAWLARVSDELHTAHGIDHATIQIETSSLAHGEHGAARGNACGHQVSASV